jgi:hypothetical protein
LADTLGNGLALLRGAISASVVTEYAVWHEAIIALTCAELQALTFMGSGTVCLKTSAKIVLAKRWEIIEFLSPNRQKPDTLTTTSHETDKPQTSTGGNGQTVPIAATTEGIRR